MGKPGRQPRALGEVRDLLIAASVAVRDGNPDGAVWRAVDAVGMLLAAAPPGRTFAGIEQPTQRGFIATVRVHHTHEG